MTNKPETPEDFISLGAKNFLDIDLNKELATRIGQEMDYRAPNNQAIKDTAEEEIISLINLCRIAPIYCANMIFETIRNRVDTQSKTYIDL